MLLETTFELFEENVAIAKEKGELSIIDVTCHAHIFGHPRGAYYYEKIVAAAVPKPGSVDRHPGADCTPRAGAKGLSHAARFRRRGG